MAWKDLKPKVVDQNAIRSNFSSSRGSEMHATIAEFEVLTLAEAAEYLRLPPDVVKHLVTTQGLPARQIADEWRFLKIALQDWLRGRGDAGALLQQAGALEDDEKLPEILKQVYENRGRPEIDHD